MNSTTQEQIELSAVLNLIPYLDENFNITGEITLKDFIDKKSGELKLNDPPKMVHRSTKLYPLPANQRALLL